MEKATMIGASIALGSGLAIGFQSTLFTVIGRTVGPVRASLILNVTGGVVAGLILLGVLGVQGIGQWTVSRQTLATSALAVSIGIGIVIGVAFSFQRMGVGAGIATVFLGQMLIGIIVDTLGLASGEATPLSLYRVAGLLVMGIAIVLLVHES